MKRIGIGLLAVALFCSISGTARGATSFYFYGTLSVTSPTFNRPNTLTTLSTAGTSVYYAVHPFTVGAAQSFNIEVDAFTGTSSDSFLALYQSSFDPTSPLTNLIARDDDGGVGFLSLITASLQPNTDYLLVMTTYGNGYVGNYGITVWGAGNVFASNVCPPEVVTGSLLGSDPALTTRVSRLTTKTCLAPGLCSASGAGGIYYYDEYVYSSGTLGQCITATLTANCGNATWLQATAYSGLVQTSAPCTNYIADIGASPEPNVPKSFSFTVADNTGFIIAVSSANSNATCAAYTLEVSECSGEPATDILWQETTGGWLYDWPMTGVKKTGGAYLSQNQIEPTWRMVGVADFNDDGKRDILWQEAAGGWLYVWYMNGVNKIGGAYLSPNQIEPTWRMVGVADFNGDGTSDILWQEETGGWLYVWYMNGVNRTGGAYLSPNKIDPTWRMVGVANFNGDGKPDILWQESTGGWLYVWYMNGVNRIGGTYLSQNQIDPAWRMVGVGDFNGSGKPDILWQESTGGWLYVWYMNGVNKTGGSFLAPNQIDPTWRMVGIGLLK